MSDEFEDKARRDRMKALLFKRNASSFYDYINFNWDHDEDWINYQEKHARDGKIENLSQQEKEQHRRDFYTKYVNPNFDGEFFLDTDSDRKEFLDYCKYYSNLGSLNTIDWRRMTRFEQVFLFLKRISYLAAFILLPLRVSVPGKLPTPQIYRAPEPMGSHALEDMGDDQEPAFQLPPIYGPYLGYVIIAFAVIFSIISRQRLISKQGNGFWANFLLEEESMCMATLFLMFFSGFIMRPFLGLTLFMWSGINVSMWGTQILEDFPDAPGLALLRPVFEFVRLHLVPMIQAKNYIEVSICIVSTVGWCFALNPPFFGIVCMQFLRLKYTTSYYTRFVFNKLNRSASRLPVIAAIYPYSFGMINSWVTQAVAKTEADHQTEERAQESQEEEEKSEEEPQVQEVVDID